MAGAGFQQSNAGEATSDGFEADFVWVPAERWSGVRLGGLCQGGPTTSTSSTSSSTTAATPSPGRPSGHSMPGPADGLELLRRQPAADTWPRSSTAYQDEFFTCRPNNDPFFMADDSQFVVNARLGECSSAERTAGQLTLWGRNLTDEDNVNSTCSGPVPSLFPLYHYSADRPANLRSAELRYDF